MNTTTATPDPADDEPTTSDVLDLDTLRQQPAPAGDPRSENLWARRRDEINRDRIAAHEAYRRQIAAAQHNDTIRQTAIDNRERALLGWRGQPVVLVRTSIGEPLRVYHRATGTCGWAGDRSRYIELFESEAKARGLRRCSGCWSH